MTPAALEAARLIDRLERLARFGEADAGGAPVNPAQWEALRYLARANRFSRTPAALADYLASTRGTVSQTLIALEQKGLVERIRSSRDRRSVDIALTAAGTAVLDRDPLHSLANDICRGAGPHLDALLAGLRGTLRRRIARNGGRAFGVCGSCLHFRLDARPGHDAPHHCALLDAHLSDADSGSICAEQVPAQPSCDGPEETSPAI